MSMPSLGVIPETLIGDQMKEAVLGEGVEGEGEDDEDGRPGGWWWGRGKGKQGPSADGKEQFKLANLGKPAGTTTMAASETASMESASVYSQASANLRSPVILSLLEKMREKLSNGDKEGAEELSKLVLMEEAREAGFVPRSPTLTSEYNDEPVVRLPPPTAASLTNNLPPSHHGSTAVSRTPTRAESRLRQRHEVERHAQSSPVQEAKPLALPLIASSGYEAAEEGALAVVKAFGWLAAQFKIPADVKSYGLGKQLLWVLASLIGLLLTLVISFGKFTWTKVVLRNPLFWTLFFTALIICKRENISLYHVFVGILEELAMKGLKLTTGKD